MVGLAELNSFVGKFVSLWRKGIDAKLVLETEGGKASVNLRTDLGQACPLPDICHGGRRDGSSRVRRRERRAAERQQQPAEKAVGNEDEKTNYDYVNPAEEAGKEIIEAEAEKAVEKIADTAEEGALQVIKSESEKKAEEALIEVKDKSDGDIYIFTYWDNFKVSEAQEALNYIEGKLKENFVKLKVKESDQVYKVEGIEKLEENEIQIKIKLKKENWLVERSARNVQTAYKPEDPVYVSIKNILR